MNAVDIAAEALEKLRVHERAIGRLYQVFAERFIEQAGFWSRLTKEEGDHARWVETLQSQIQDDPASLVTDRFPMPAIEHSIAFVERLIVKAAGRDFTSLNALSAALGLEEGLLENKYFQAFQTDRAEMKRILKLLEDEARAHYLAVRKAWQAARGD